jgi:UDP-4-amino-4,6-dideoxy-N-acetyl-beta-L-altrosamine N-acetyltransferase
MYTDHYISKKEHKQWLEKLKTKNNNKAWIIKYKGRPIGLVSLSNIDYKKRSTDWGLYIADEKIKGKGIGSLTLYKLMKMVFDEMNFNKMYTKVLDNNHVAIGLYEKFSFKKEGKPKEKLTKDGKHIDIFIMELRQDEWINKKEELENIIKNQI